MAEASSSGKKETDSSEEELKAQASKSAEHSDDEEGSSMMENLRRIFMKNLKLETTDKKEPEKVLNQVNLDGIVEYINSGKCKNIIAMVGAGISTSAGIPDFRSPGSGLYSNLAKYKLPTPECMFDINFFKGNPEPFFQLAKELFPGKFRPTPCHYFLRLLHEKQLLLRLYTQNIDTLERIAGIPADRLIEAHGTFFTSHCLDSKCKKEYSLEWMKEKIFSDEVPKCEECKSTVKPDIVFFGERLPSRFFELADNDFAECDLLVIIGTSLTVQPFASLVDNVSQQTPRLMINKTVAGSTANPIAKLLGLSEGLDFDSEHNYRDVLWLGLCDDGCKTFAEKLGWKDELDQLMEEEYKKID